MEIKYDDTIIVTGGWGFLGSHTVNLLEMKGYNNLIIPRSSEYNLINFDDCERLITENHPKIIIHLAGKTGGIGATKAEPGTFFYNNLIMGLQLMELSRINNVRKFVGMGTVCSYPKFAQIPFKEEDLWKGYPEETNAPYGISKKMMAVQSQAYYEQYGYNSIHLLLVNLYGPGDKFDLEKSHVIPALIMKCVDAQSNDEPEIVLWGDGSPTREFIYVEDAAEAVILATEQYNKPAPINIGSGFEISIKDLAEKITQITGYHGKIKWDKTKPNGQPRRRLDVSKAEDAFGFKAKIDFDVGLRRTVKWYLKHKK